MRTALLFFKLFILLSSQPAFGSKILASSFGFDADDATAAFQAAVQSGYDTVVVDVQMAPWTVQPNTFFDLNGLTLIFQPGVELVAKPGAFPASDDCLLRFVRCENINVWGYGAIFRMQKNEYLNGDARHTLSINNCKEISVSGLTLRDSGGDGIYVSGDEWWGPLLYSERVFIRDCICDNHRRRGMSVVSVTGMGVDNCWFQNTNGTLPESGVELKPDHAGHHMRHVAFRNCRFTGNAGNGIQLSLQNLQSASDTIGILFERCYVSDNHDPANTGTAAEVAIVGHQDDAVKGLVTFTGCLVENSRWGGVYARKPTNAFFVEFLGCVFLNVSQDTTLTQNEPLQCEATSNVESVGRFGGLIFHGSLLKYQTGFNWFGTYESNTSPGLGGLEGDIIVVNPLLPAADFGVDPDDVTITISVKDSLQKPQTQIVAIDPIGFEPPVFKPIQISFYLTGGDPAPLAIKYAISGQTTQTDYSLLPGFAIVWPTSADVYIMPVADDLTESTEKMTVTLLPSDCHTPLVDTADCFILGTNTAVQAPDFASWTTFPNPASDYLQIQSDGQVVPFEIRDVNGKLSGSGNTTGDRINVSRLPAGCYYLFLPKGRIARFVKQ